MKGVLEEASRGKYYVLQVGVRRWFVTVVCLMLTCGQLASSANPLSLPVAAEPCWTLYCLLAVCNALKLTICFAA